MAKFKYEKFGNTTYFPSGSTVGNAQGDVTYIGGGEVTAGYIYYLSPIATLGTYEWTFADADFTTTSGGLLAVALGTGIASTVGMLLRGMVTLAIAPQGGTTPGMNLYLSASAGRATTTAPTNDFPRTIGFTTTAAVGGVYSKLIWFNTDNGFVGGLGAATGISFNNITALASTVSPVNGTAAVGTSTTVARQDHVHGTDTSRAPTVSPTFTGTVTGISKSMVDLGNVDNTSNATERAAAATLTNKTLTTPIISSISNTGTLTLPTSTDTLVGRATTDTLTNKTLRRTVESKTIDYTLVASDAGKVILMNAGGVDITIPANVFTEGDEFTIINNSGNPTACLVITAAGVTMFVVGTAYLNSSFTLAARRGLKFICAVGGGNPRFYGWRS